MIRFKIRFKRKNSNIYPTLHKKLYGVYYGCKENQEFCGIYEIYDAAYQCMEDHCNEWPSDECGIIEIKTNEYCRGGFCFCHYGQKHWKRWFLHREDRTTINVLEPF